VTHKLLLDENLSPKVAETLRREDGIDAVHVRDRGLLRTPDDVLLERAFREDRVLVTCNVEHFVGFARVRDLHAGLILVQEGDLRRDQQLEVVRRALTAMKGKADMANVALRVSVDGKLVFEEIPPG